MSRRRFASVTIEAGLLHADLLDRVLGDDALAHREATSYGLAPHESVRQAAARAYEYLRQTWAAFTAAREAAMAEGRPLTALTRDRWLLVLLRELGYGLVPATPAGGIGVGGAAFKVSHCWEHVPIHLLGWGTDLDHRTRGVAGAADAAPQSMVQDLLNRGEKYLWAIVSNGAKLRLLRDSRSLVSSAYVEFDLAEIFDTEQFSDFVLLYRLAHASRFQVAPGAAAGTCLLEQWRATAIRQGERALDELRGGVQAAIETLATGFLRHPDNEALRTRLADGTLTKDDYRRAVLRLVYRMLFWFVAEDRDVLLAPNGAAEAKQRYQRFFSSRRLRERALGASDDRHHDLWEAARLVFTALGEDRGLPALALPGIGGLFERIPSDGGSLPDALDEPLEGAALHNGALLEAVRHLAYMPGRRAGIDFARLGSEELGSVYESLLELHPDLDSATRTFTLVEAAGNERKTTGSYYTPTPLTETLLDSALDPVLDEAVVAGATTEEKVEALLAVTVCDPACGSGHFLVAAARRIARRIATLRSGEDEPSPELIRAAMREVVSRCIHGVDVGEMAAELAKVSLWLESVEPGKPLAFLDANVRVGNSLLGATPALIERGIPKEAFKPLEGDDPKVARAIARDNESQQEAGQGELFASHDLELDNAAIANSTRRIIAELPQRLSDVQVQRRRLRDVDATRLAERRVADAWCAAFTQELTEATRATAVTRSALDWIAGGPTTDTQRAIAEEVDALARDYRFFHWHVEFPHIFAVPADGTGVDEATGWRGGFTCVIGNPPWDRVKLQEKEFFASRDEEIANAPHAAARKKMIAALESSDDPADRQSLADFRAALRRSDGITLLLREAGRYPLTGHGDINTYQVFAETGRTVLDPHGRAGLVLPTGIVTDATTAPFFGDLVATRSLASVYDFENEEKIFPAVDHRVRFCLMSFAGRAVDVQHIHLAFRARQVDQIADKRFELTPDDIAAMNPNTLTCPVFDSPRHAEIVKDIYRRVPVLWNERTGANPWGIRFLAMLHMANDSGLFRFREDLEKEGWRLDGNIFVRGDERMLPLYEAKMIHHFDSRHATYEDATQAQLNVGTLPRIDSEQHADPEALPMPRYWVEENEVNERLARRSWDKGWLLGWRDICRSTDERTVICGALPRVAVGHTFPLVLTGMADLCAMIANSSSFVLDYVARQKLSGTHVTYGIITQLPILPPDAYKESVPWLGEAPAEWIRDRVLELTYTGHDMAAFAGDLGDDGPPFVWDEERRFAMRAELDAGYFHLYGIERDDVDYILDSFRAFRNNDPDRFARTKKTIAEIYDAMAEAARTGVAYRTILDPPPGRGPRHPASARGVGA